MTVTPQAVAAAARMLHRQWRPRHRLGSGSCSGPTARDVADAVDRLTAAAPPAPPRREGTVR